MIQNDIDNYFHNPTISPNPKLLQSNDQELQYHMMNIAYPSDIGREIEIINSMLREKR